MFSFYQIHPTSINKTAGEPSTEDGITAKVSETTHHQSIQHGFHLSFGAKLLHKARPKTPHCELIPSCLKLISTLGIFGILSIMACHQLYICNHSSKGGISNALLQGISGTSNFSASKGVDNFGISKRANPFVLTTSFADGNSQQLNKQIRFDTDLISLFAIIQPMVIFVTTFGTLSRVPFNKLTKASQLQMGWVLVFKKFCKKSTH
jgi:hypothetical protein